MRNFQFKNLLQTSFPGETGQALVIILIVLGLIIVNTLLIITGSVTYLQTTKYDVEKTQATNLAEAGIDKAVASLNATGGTYNGEGETSLGEGSYSVSITPIDTSTSIIQATGYVPNKTKPVATKTIKIQISKGSGLSFSYGVLVGQGGLDMSGGSTINGTVYSNGNITMSSSGPINGNAYVAGGTQAIADQQSDCTSSCQDFIVGKNVSGSNQYDVAQSFKSNQTTVLNKVSLKLKKNGIPPNADVKILSNNAGSPNKSNPLASATLNGGQITNQYGGFIDVVFSSPPSLTAGTTYWIMIDTSALAAYDRNNNYWIWDGDTLPNWGFKWSTNWQQNPNPTWSIPNPQGDLSFQTWMGGVATYISGSGGTSINGSAYANTITAAPGGLSIAQQAYYQSIDTNTRVSNSACPNVNCHPNSTDPPPQALPISQSNIDYWDSQALSQGTTNGNVSYGQPCTAVLKGYYSGNVTLPGAGCQGQFAIKTMTPIHIKGNFSMSGGAQLKLDPSYGAASGVIVVDGTINLSGGSNVMGTGDASGKSLMLLLSTYPSPGGAAAITTSGGNVSSILYANNGNINISGGGQLYEVVGQKLTISGGGTVNYQSGVPVPQLPTGPSGSYSVIKGTYQLK